jgi:uncharacterized membrane protein YvlD (DUF360 family)
VNIQKEKISFSPLCQNILSIAVNNMMNTIGFIPLSIVLMGSFDIIINNSVEKITQAYATADLQRNIATIYAMQTISLILGSSLWSNELPGKN